MTFKTNQAQEVYTDIIADTSKRVADMFAEVDKMELDDRERFFLRTSIHTFHQEGMCRAVQTATSVDMSMMSLQGGLAIAALKE